jgi:putative protein kinase ArgK-like GTPase of G3E family
MSEPNRQRIDLDEDVVARLLPITGQLGVSMTWLVNAYLRAIVAAETRVAVVVDPSRSRLPGKRRGGSWKVTL